MRNIPITSFGPQRGGFINTFNENGLENADLHKIHAEGYHEREITVHRF